MKEKYGVVKSKRIYSGWQKEQANVSKTATKGLWSLTARLIHELTEHTEGKCRNAVTGEQDYLSHESGGTELNYRGENESMIHRCANHKYGETLDGK